MAERRRSLANRRTTAFGRMQKRLSQLPITVEDNTEHWRRIERALLESGPKTDYDRMVEEHFQGRRKTIAAISPSERRILQKSVGTQKPTVHAAFTSESKQPWESESIFERYTDFGELASEAAERERQEKKNQLMAVDKMFGRPSTPTAVKKSTREIHQQLYKPTEHVKGRAFPNRQLTIYVVADPTDMRIELATLRLYVWPHLLRACRARGFALQIIDQSAGTDVDPPSRPELDFQQTRQIFDEHLCKRDELKTYLNCLILLSNRSVGPVPRLPARLREQTILYVKESAQREIDSISAEVKELKRQLYSADANQEQKDQKPTKFESTDNISQASGLSTGSRISVKEDLLRHKSELIQALCPDVLNKWYHHVSSGPNEAERTYHLQPVRSVYPDVLRYEDQSRRQAAIECWLKDSHHIACLFMRYIKPCQKNAGDTEASPSNMAGRRGSNLGTTTMESDEDATKERVPDEEDRAFIMKSAIEEQLDAFLPPGKESKDCFVVVRLHDDQSRQSRLFTSSKRSESLSLPTNRSVSNVSLFATNGPTNPLLDGHLEAPFKESENRAKRVVEDSILCVPPANQSQYDLAVFTHLTLEDRIFRKRPPLEPLDQRGHSSYLEALCRSIREQFMTSLGAEMNRRMETERQNQYGAEGDKLKIWDLEYEISAHWEMCEKMASEFVGQSEKLDEIVGWIDSCIKEIQNVDEDVDPTEGRFHWLTVSGSSGCGKSVFLAKLAKTMLLDEYMQERARVIYRSIGSSTVSLKLLDTLHYLCCELSTQMKPSLLPQNYDGLRNAMHDALIEASYEQPSSLPLVVILDGLESFEEFAQRSAYFPVSWLPVEWVLRQPRLNCPVFFILGASTITQDSEKIPGITGLLDLLHIPQVESTRLKHVQLTPLGERDMNICLRVWMAGDYLNQHTVEEDLQLKPESGPLNLLSLKLLQAMRIQGNDLNELEDYTPSTVLHAWFACAEQEFGYEKVQFIMGHLLAARWGLDMEDVLTLGLHSMRNRIQVTPGVKMMHRHTLAAVNWDQWFTSVSTDELAVTFHWVVRFFNAYLIPTGILCQRRGPPDGSAIFYYLRHGAVHHVAQVRYLEKLDNIRTYRNLSFWALQEMQMRGFASLSGWRWIFELPCYLSQSGQFERLRNVCFFSPTWLREVMDVSVQFNQYYTNVYLLIEEIVKCLCYLNEEKVLFTVATIPTERSNYDPFVLAICTILESDDDLLRLLTALGGWIPRMKQDPVLLNSLIYGTFYSKQGGLKDLGNLAERVQHEMNNLVLKPINFNTQVSVGCADYVAERLISSFQNSSLTFARTSLYVTALAYSPNRRYLATATKDRVTLKTKIDIWQLSTNQIVWSQTVGLGLVDRIDQLVWVTNQATLAVEFPKHRMTVWPIDKEKRSWGETYLQLSDNRGKAQESCLVYAVETPVAGISYVLILNLADFRIDVWRWKWTSLEYMHTSITLVESEQMPLRQYSTEVHHRRRSSLAPKPSIGLFIAATVRNNLFHFVCASRNEAVARLVSFELKDKDLVLDFKNKIKEELLSCPNQGARIFALDIVENGPVILASRAPSEFTNNSGVVGCLDLFDLPSGKLLKHIEGEPATLEFIESGPAGGFGLMSNSIPPQLKLFSSPDATSVVSVSESFEKKIKTDISMEVVCWNLVNRTNLTLASAALLPHLVTEMQRSLPLPVLADNCGDRLLSLCFPPPVSDPNIIWNCSPLKRAQKTSPENASEKYSICTLVSLNAPNKQSITYIYQDQKNGWHFGLLLEMEGSQVGAESCDRYIQKIFHVQPVESKIWSSTDRFLLGGNLLVVLSNLTYSEERGECKEAFREMDIYKLHEPTTGSKRYELTNLRHLTEVTIVPGFADELFVWNGTHIVGVGKGRKHFCAWSLEHGGLDWKMSPKVEQIDPLGIHFGVIKSAAQEERSPGMAEGDDVSQQVTTSKPPTGKQFSPETLTVGKFIVSGDGSVIVASFDPLLCCVFLPHYARHAGTLNERYARSGKSSYYPASTGNSISLTTSALSINGNWIVYSEFSSDEGSACVTVWNLYPLKEVAGKSSAGKSKVPWYRKRLTNQSDVVAIGVASTRCTVAFAQMNDGVSVWYVDEIPTSCRRLIQSEKLVLSNMTQPMVQVSLDGTRVVVASGSPDRQQLSVWKVGNEDTVLLGHIFSPANILDFSMVLSETVVAIKAEKQNKPLLVWIGE